MCSHRTCLVGVGALILGVGTLACDAVPSQVGTDHASTEKIGVSSSAVVSTGLFATGVDDTGASRTPTNGTLRDTHYELVATTDPSISVLVPAPVYVVQPDTQTTNQWIANTPTGEWISPFASTIAGATSYTYTYQTTFTIPAAVDPTKVVLSGLWACDDQCTITVGLTGSPVASNSTATHTSPDSKLWAFAIPEGTFTSRSVTLDFVVDNSGAYETGLLVSGFGGCTLDSQCRSTEFCDTLNGPCVNKLANGTSIPILAGHTPPLTGACPSNPDAGGAVGTAVCISDVCDPSNGECGLANGHGPCTSGAVCQSGVCDTDGLCGYKDGDGPCTESDAGADAGSASVCRSGICSALGTCGNPPDAGLDAASEAQADSAADAGADAPVDAAVEAQSDGGLDARTDAAGEGDAGVDAPSDSGADTSAAAVDAGVDALSDSGMDAGVDVAAEAETDAAPDAPFDATTEAGVLLDAAADVGTVIDAGSKADAGCAVDSDCPAADYCNTPTSTCVPKLPNGQGIPNIAGHSPALTGTCQDGVGVAVCASGACDIADNECGLANGDGPCVPGDAGVAVCRSGQCNSAGVCGPPATVGCTVDSDCSSAQWCDTSKSACVAKLSNGTAVPNVTGHSPTLNGACLDGVGSAVCSTGVCDTKDNLCGYAFGDGPCTAAQASVCRSGTACLSSAGVCGDPFVASGNGVSCAIGMAGAAHRGTTGGVGAAIGIAFAMSRRRRKRSAA
jgi:hypothetical protein